MSATVAAYEAVMKQVWTQDRLESQLIAEDPLLDQLQSGKRYQIGKEAVVPLHKGRSGGYSVKPASGGALNAPDEQKVDSAVYGYTHHYFQVEMETAAIDQTDGAGAKSAADVVDTEVTGALADLRNQLVRQFVTNGDALIAQCTTTTAANEVELLTTGYGFGAIERGWLYEGLVVDIGTTADEGAIATDRNITAVEEVSGSPSITIDGAAVTTTSSHYVSIANARSGATSYEANGLMQIAGSTTSAVGGLDPDTAGEGFWKPASVDTSTTSLSLDVMYTKNRQIMQKTGNTKGANWVLTSLKQQEEFYKLLQMQTRFDGDRNLGAGNVGGVMFANMKVDAHPAILDRWMFFLNKDHLFLVAGEKPHWQNKYTGGKILEWKQGYTSMVATLMYRCQLATNRRNAFASLAALTA